MDVDYPAADRPAFPCPVQIVRFGNDLSLVALGAETVADYSLRLQRELAGPGGR